jgi:H+-transporting ATPase
MLESAIVLDLVLGCWIEAIIIASWLVFSALLGFHNENKAQTALALLKQRLVINVRVQRDNTWQIIPPSELVPGDYVHLSAGNVVPTDIKIIDSQIQVDQSRLTGESLPVERKPGEIVYAGSLVTRGEAIGLVEATGAKTYYGKTAELVRLAKAPARIDILITRVAKYLCGVRHCSCTFSPFNHDCPRSAIDWSTSFYFTAFNNVCSRSRASNVYHVGFPWLADVIKKRVLVTRLSAIEDVALMDVLCIDKTGTLTENRLVVEKVISFDSTKEEEVIELAAMASNEAAQDPISLTIPRR